MFVAVTGETGQRVQAGDTSAYRWSRMILCSHELGGSAGGEDGDTAIVAATHLSSEGGSVLLRRETATAFQTGPLLGATADSAGYQLLVDPEGFPDPGCQFGCKAKIAVGFTAVGIILTTLLGN